MTTIRTVVRVDWWQIITDLQRLGYSRRMTGRAIEVPITTVQGWHEGAEPRHEDGERLIAFWCEVLERTRDQVPRKSRYEW